MVVSELLALELPLEAALLLGLEPMLVSKLKILLELELAAGEGETLLVADVAAAEVISLEALLGVSVDAAQGPAVDLATESVEEPMSVDGLWYGAEEEVSEADVEDSGVEAV